MTAQQLIEQSGCIYLSLQERRKAIESLQRMSDAELKGFILMQLCVCGPTSKLLPLAEEIQLARS